MTPDEQNSRTLQIIAMIVLQAAMCSDSVAVMKDEWQTWIDLQYSLIIVTTCSGEKTS